MGHEPVCGDRHGCAKLPPAPGLLGEPSFASPVSPERAGYDRADFSTV
ncbi:MAG: hypothetical protein KME26_14990 [Oscillatoria princeps RMCB-10]|nr:hypothetical protein [Oscillatoria princeps RMCB-10]